MSIPKINETPSQKIKRLEKELSDERLKNEILNRMIDLSDRQYGTAIRKSLYPNDPVDRGTRASKLEL